MDEVRENCRRVLERISKAAARSGRESTSIRLIAVTKTVPVERIRAAFECGIREVGENRFQEGAPKRQALAELPLTWHFIGHLQTNKAKKVVESFDWVQSVDRVDLAEKLNQYATRLLPVLIEVKLHEEPNKSGISENRVGELVNEFGRFDRLQLRGFMAIPPVFDNPENSRPFFARLRKLGEQFALPDVSMGMSSDFEVAIEEGATMVRIGTALFGARHTK
ncbi:MAG: YggS family pyridoxal phosphate-dependent enzyme [Acidobacteria bacterium]|nr:YggS family pyridoxal phosphate-dependent enzyme [Acidobacteriota bacterium]